MGMIDAGVNGQRQYAGKAYLFKGDRYVRYDWTQDTVDQGYPQPLTAWHLPGKFASGIDTAINGEGQYEGKAYFFRGDRYVRYDWTQDTVDQGYPQPLTAWHLPGELATGIDAALDGQRQYAGKAYFFRGDQYVRYDWVQDKVDEGYPQPLEAWHLPGEFASGIDAAINGERQYAGKAYFFKGDQYVRYDWAQDTVDQGYPKPIAGNWPGIEVLG
jgi:Hemopexin